MLYCYTDYFAFAIPAFVLIYGELPTDMVGKKIVKLVISRAEGFKVVFSFDDSEGFMQ